MSTYIQGGCKVHLTCTLRKTCKLYIVREIVVYKSYMALRKSLHSVLIFFISGSVSEISRSTSFIYIKCYIFVPQLENMFNFAYKCILLFISLNPINNEIFKKTKRSWKLKKVGNLKFENEKSNVSKIDKKY